jgi:formate/nitrite transporter
MAQSNVFTPSETVDILSNNSVNKVTYPVLKVVLLGMMAGLMISFGADAFIMVSHAIDNAGLAKMAGGAVFPVGLIAIVLSGSELLTGSCLNVLGIPTGKITLAGVLKNALLVGLANGLGAAALAAGVYYMGQLDTSAGRMGAYVIKMAVGKVTMGFGPAVVSGIWCNVLVCLAIFLAAASTQVAGKALAIFFPIWVFVTSGFEHSVANMFYLPLGLLAKGNAAYAQAADKLYGIGADQLSQLTLTSCLTQNLLPVIIGNVIGGALVVAGCFYLALKKSK